MTSFRCYMVALLLAAGAVNGGPLHAQSPPRTLQGSLGMVFSYIPPGEFVMGSPADEPGRGPDESLRRTRITRGFYLQQTEVTQDQWQAVMGSNPSKFKSCGGNCPVESVSWESTQHFIFKLNRDNSGERYRLPTEAEWEYACRAGTTTPFFNGDMVNKECGYDPVHEPVGWYFGNAGRTPHPVAGKMPNPWQLYDMHGNVWEWCQDWYGPTEPSTVAIPDPAGPSFGWGRVFKGGSWGFVAHCSRAANRKWVVPTFPSDNIGLRLVLEPARQGPVP